MKDYLFVSHLEPQDVPAECPYCGLTFDHRHTSERPKDIVLIADYSKDIAVLETPDSTRVGSGWEEEWELGSLTFDKLQNIMEICNVKSVKIEQDYLSINFVPKNATGKVWKELKEKMLQIIET